MHTSGFDLNGIFEQGGLELPHLSVMFLRMTIATLLGACVSYRVWRVIWPAAPPPTIQGAHAQTLIAAAGAVMVVVIGDHPARRRVAFEYEE